MLLYLEGFALLLEVDAEVDVEGGVVGAEGSIVGILHIPAGIYAIKLFIYILLDELGVEVFQTEELAGAVYHRHAVAGGIYHLHRGYARNLGDLVVVGAESRGDVHDAGTVFYGNIVTGDNPESAFARVDPREKLLVCDARQLAALELAVQHAERVLVVEVRRHQGLCQYVYGRLLGVGVHALNADIVDIGTDAECGVRREGPGSSGPCQEVYRQFGTLEQFGRGVVAHDLELRRDGGVLHVAVASGLIELVGTQARSRSGGIGLDGVSLVEISFLVYLLEQIPEGLDVSVVVGHIGVVHIHPIADALGQVDPLFGIFHDLLAAGMVVVVYRNLLADVLFGDAEHLLHTEFDRQSVSIPTRLTLYQEAALSLVAAHRILDGAGHDMVYAGHSVGRRRTFEKDEFRSAFAQLQNLPEGILLAPGIQYFAINLNQI